MTAEKYQTEHYEIIVKPADVSAVGELIDHFDEPFGDSSMLPTFQIARVARNYVKVCISGDGGDELFGGYDHYLEAMRWAWLDDLPGIMLKPFFKLGARLWPDWVPGKGTLGRFSASPAGRYQRQIGVFDVQERRRLLRTRHGDELCQDARLFEAYFSQSNLDTLSRCQLMDQQTYLPEDILVKVDRAAMRTGLEVRIPFLDHRVVELVNGMPSALKIRGGQRKHVLRRVLTGVVRHEILDGPKRGFGVPLKYWFRDELSSFAGDMLASQSTRISGIMDGREVRRILQNHERGGRDLSDRVWALLVLEQWCRTNGA